LDDDDTSSKRKHNPRLSRILLTKKPYNGKKVDHPQLEVVAIMYLHVATIVDLLVLVVMILQEVVTTNLLETRV
jgi:hypothetical protein